MEINFRAEIGRKGEDIWGKGKALVVGIGKTSPTLHGCCNDSEAIKDLLSNHGNGDPNFQFGKRITLQQKEN